MKFVARLFSALCLVALVLGLWLAWRPQPESVAPVAPPPAIPAPPREEPVKPGPGWTWPSLPEFHLPKLSFPDVARPPAPKVPITSPVERILVEKAARRMTVWQKDGPPKTFNIALGFSPKGNKTRQGDGRTPEGTYYIDRLNRQSKYHLSLGLDYPQKSQREAARRAGIDPGGDIMIHGQPNQIAEGFKVKGDWTAGCIALTNPEIEEIFAHAAIGTKVEIRP